MVKGNRKKVGAHGPGTSSNVGKCGGHRIICGRIQGPFVGVSGRGWVAMRILVIKLLKKVGTDRCGEAFVGNMQ